MQTRNEVPLQSDIVHVIDPPFFINASETWEAVGVSVFGLILRSTVKPDLLAWFGQVLKFSPSDDYVSPVAIERELEHRKIPRKPSWKAS